MKNIYKLALVSAFAFCSVAIAGSNYSYAPQQYNNNTLQGYASYVPAGVTVEAVLGSEINSQTAVVGQAVTAVLTDDFIYNSNLVASSGSIMQGTVVSNKKAGIGTRNGKTKVRFTTIRTPYNNLIPISAMIQTSDSSGVLKGGAIKDNAKDYAKDTVIGAGSGAVLGTAMGALSGGSVGKGAVYGTAVGAGIGLLKKASEKGDAVLIPANSRVNIVFDQPITLNAQ